MKYYIKTQIALLLLLAVIGCNSKTSTKQFVENTLDRAIEQSDILRVRSIEEVKTPRYAQKDGEIVWGSKGFDWTEGFFAGTCWYLYEYSKDTRWKDAADKLEDSFKSHRYLTTNHDLGFVFGTSFGNRYRLEKDSNSKQILIDAGNSLITRFNPKVGAIQSWDVDGGWQSKRDWSFPVIIDNMMNLELLFNLSEITGDSKYREIAVTHANTTLKNHFREDASSYHVIDYDSITGSVRHRETAQGYAHESRWARGQAWGLYGYTVCYRYTKDPIYLKKAVEIADLILDHKGMAEDLIPYWDYDAPDQPGKFKDVSAAAVTASALIELSSYSNKEYLAKAKKIITNLSSDRYSSEPGEFNGFILKHSVGSLPHGAEVDLPLVYADYYYIEALIRLSKLDKI